MFSSADKTTKPTQVQPKAAAPTAFLQRKAEAPFFGGHTPDTQPFFSPSTIQPKLSISQPGDAHEKEADSMAERVMTMPGPAPVTPAPEREKEIQKKEEPEGTEAVPATALAQHIQCSEDKEEKKWQPKFADSIARKEADNGVEEKEAAIPSLPRVLTIDRKAHSPPFTVTIQRQGRAPPAPQPSFESSLHSTKGSGSTMPDSTRQFMENRFGADFGGVRIHTGSTAVQLNRDIHAQAFTHGNDIYFNTGRYAPHTPEGGLLLAHELTHTLQQGASKSLSPAAIAAKRQTIQRQASGASPPRISNLDAAVNIAKGETGKVDAGSTGPDGFRVGWERLVDYFRTSFGSEKILPEGATYQPGTVSIANIKTRKTISGMKPNQPDPMVRENRDAMPSWCGIFVFWALNKAGLPMPKWVLGKTPVTPAAAYPPGYAPRPGDIAYRNKFSHFALVERAEGSDVYTVNGNTAGENNLGGQVQVKKHAVKEWTAFFDPLFGIDPAQVSAPAAAAMPKTLRQLQQEILAGVQRKEEQAEETIPESSSAEQAHVQTKPETGHLEVTTAGKLQAITPATVQPKQDNHTEQEAEAAGKETGEPGSLAPIHAIHRMADAKALTAVGISSRHDCVSRFTELGFPAAGGGALSSAHDFEEDTSSVLSMDRGPPVQRMAGGGEGEVIQCSLIDNALTHIGEFLNDIPITLDIDEAKRWLLGKARQFASYIPGYRAMGVVLGYDPITGAEIQRNGRNFIEAALDIIPGGSLLQQKLDELGVIDTAAAWIDTQLAALEAIIQNVRNEFTEAFGALGLRSILDGPTTILRNLGGILERAINNVIRFAERAATELLDIVKRFLLDHLVAFIREQTPAYPLLRVVLGKDPVTGEEVPRNGTNILDAMLELSEEGREQRRQMQETGSFERVAAWIDTGIGIFSGAYDQIINGFHNIWNHVTIQSLMDPVGTFRMIYNEFAAPVGRVLNYMEQTARMILQFIKEVLMRRLSAWARTVRGYPLVTVILGRDPFTNEAVPRTVHNIIRGFMSLMEGGEEQYNQLAQSGAIDRTVARINAAVARLNMTPAYIVALFTELWNSFSIRDLANPMAAFRRIMDRFGEPIGRLIAFVVEIVRIVIEVLLQVMNFPTDLIANIITKAMQAFEMIKRDPVGFLKNLLRAIKQGFIQFFDNILTHLLNGLTGWLMSELRDANVPAPTDFTLRGIIGWVLQVLGISMENIWQKLAAHPRIGPERVARIRSMINTLEGVWTFIRDVQERGVAAIWDKIQEQLSNLWDTVLNAIKSWIMDRIVNAVVTRLLSMLDPTGIMAVINSAIALYRAVQSFIRYLRQMLEIVNSFVEGVVEIASGNITRAANFLERTLARAVPIVIGFLANQVGLSGLGRRIGEMITAARQMVDRALTWLVNRAVDTAFAVLDRIMAMGRSAVAAVRGWLGFRERFTTQNGTPHTVYVQQAGATASLIIESTPTPVGTFFNQKETEINTSTAIPAAEKSRLLGRITHGKNLLQGLQALMNNDATNQDPRIPSMITEVIAIVREIDGGSVSNVPPAAAVFEPRFSMGVKATSFNARYMHKGGTYRNREGVDVTVAKNHPDGSEPGDTTLREAFVILSGMRLNNSWVRFHIVNADFGGLGIDSNLIPTPGYINNPEYLHQFENHLKTHYNNGLPIWLRASITYRSTPFNGLFVAQYSATGGAMKYQNNQWVEDTDRQVPAFSRSIDLPQSESFNINFIISNPDYLAIVVRLSTVTTAMFNLLRDNQPPGGYTYYRQMERVLANSVVPGAVSFDPEGMTNLSPTAAQVREINNYRNRLSSVNWVF